MAMAMDTILTGDCLEYLKSFPDECIDLVVTSPPYDNMRQYNGAIAQWNFEKFALIAQELKRVLKRGGVIVWIVSDQTRNGSESGTSFRQALHFMEIGLNLHDTMIWSKPQSSMPSSNRYFQTFEYMFVFSKGKPKTFNPIEDRKNKWAGTAIHGRYRQPDGSMKERKNTSSIVKEYGMRFNVWDQPPDTNNQNRWHPAQFPEKLAMDHIVSWSNEGDLVLDPFIGSGTTAIAAKKCGRHYIGIEIDSQYAELAKKRIDESLEGA